MLINVYIDESGSIHKNSPTAYFAIGGFLVVNTYKNKVIAHYKRENKKIKDLKNIPLATEIKANQMTEAEKIGFFKAVQDIPTFRGGAKVFLKKRMAKAIMEANIFYNYAVKIFFCDCLIPQLKKLKLTGPIEFKVSIDNRSIRVKDLANLENYLNTEFCLQDYHFQITYYDSQTNYGIQLADLIVNTFYNFYKNPMLVKPVMKTVKMQNFRVSTFPYYRLGAKFFLPKR